jgi:hypothetical protein
MVTPKYSRLSIRERIVDGEHHYAIFIAPYGKRMERPLILTVPPRGTWITPEEKRLVVRCVAAQVPVIVRFASLDEAIHIFKWLDKEREKAERAEVGLGIPL